VFAGELASHGVVVFGTDYSGSPEYAVECGYRHVLEVAPDYGGDLTQPVTLFGYSAGGSGAFWHGLGEDKYGPDATYGAIPCPPGAERPGIIVSVNACHVTTTEIEGRIRFWGNPDAQITLISGDSDDVCGAWQSIEGHRLLVEAGYAATYEEIPDANHWEPVFHDLAYGNYSTLDADHPAGQATVRATLDAIGIRTEPSN
jgi:hypothetical protein